MGLKGEATSAATMAGIGIGGVALAKLLGADEADSKQNPKAPGGGHSSEQQRSTRRSSDPRRTGMKRAPKPSPRPAAIPSAGEHIQRSRVGTSRKEELQLMVYESFKKLGYTDEAAKTMVAEVGRENGFNEDTAGKRGDVFGYHIDPGNKELNVGLISWQKERGRKLERELKKQGLIVNGQLERSQKTMDAMAKFLDEEMKSDPKMRSAHQAARDETKKFDELEAIIGSKVIKWVHDKPGRGMSQSEWKKIHSAGHANQKFFYNSITNLLSKGPMDTATKEGDLTIWRKDTPEQTKAAVKQFKSTQGKKLKSANGATIVNSGNSSTVVLAPPRKADARAEVFAASLREKRRVPNAKPNQSWSELGRKYFGW
jgi:hypothetical protein